MSLFSRDQETQEPDIAAAGSKNARPRCHDKDDPRMYDPHLDRRIDIDAGGRAKEGYVRPSAIAINGTPVRSSFDLEKVEYTLEFCTDASTHHALPTDIYVPRTVHFQAGFHVKDLSQSFAQKSSWTIESFRGWDIVHYHHDRALARHCVKILPKA